MEGNRSSSSRRMELLAKIRDFTRSLVKGLSDGRSPAILIDKFSNYCTHPHGNCCCGSDMPEGQEILTIRRECHAHRIDVLLRVLLIVQKLLQENRHGSKRDIYYMHPSVFSEQSIVDRAINDICILLQCSRHNLNVVSVANGLVMGWVRFVEAGMKFDCINSLSKVRMAIPIPVYVEEVRGISFIMPNSINIVSVAKYILIVEKESVFQRLANDHFCEANRCIVITVGTYPHSPPLAEYFTCSDEIDCFLYFVGKRLSRYSYKKSTTSGSRFLRLLMEKLRLPVYCLVDCDPYGFDILTTYRFGSMQMAYDAKFLRLKGIHWLGAFPSDVGRYEVPEQCLLPLTTEDKRRTEKMLLRCYLEKQVPEWRWELEMMLQRGVKYEIEALAAHSLSFLSQQYIPSKIQGGLHL
ncbi:Meiotic recombination protein SPO11-1 [Linum perenne]